MDGTGEKAMTLTLALSHLMGEGIHAACALCDFTQLRGFLRVWGLRMAPQLKLELRTFVTEYDPSDGLCAF